MNSSKMQQLVLASPLNIPFNFICVIISYEEHCISRLVCKRIMEFIDALYREFESCRRFLNQTYARKQNASSDQATSVMMLQCNFNRSVLGFA